MLGEMLLERGRAAEALAAFEAVLVREPNRFRTVFGAGRAAERAGDEVKAKAHYRALLDIAKTADTERAELKHARAFVSR
jgi:tetratricopeptide (TPR) repeat protein